MQFDKNVPFFSVVSYTERNAQIGSIPNTTHVFSPSSTPKHAYCCVYTTTPIIIHIANPSIHLSLLGCCWLSWSWVILSPECVIHKTRSGCWWSSPCLAGAPLFHNDSPSLIGRRFRRRRLRRRTRYGKHHPDSAERCRFLLRLLCDLLVILLRFLLVSFLGYSFPGCLSTIDPGIFTPFLLHTVRFGDHTLH